MDLSFARLDRKVTVTALPSDLAVLMVGVSARQAASPTARVQASLLSRRAAAIWLAPRDGCFSHSTVLVLTGWRRR